MSDVTRILIAIERGDPHAAAQLLPLVYDELRTLAARKLAQEKPGQTLQATALVHEAYLRLVDVEQAQHFNSRGHFFAACAEAMRRILVEQARRKQADKRGGRRQRVSLADADIGQSPPDEELLAIDDALAKLARENGPVARLVELRYFAGLGMEECAAVLDVTVRTAQRYWAYARAWLHHEIGAAGEAPSGDGPDHKS
jgi:RNA polymerase sigma factor (TIGR02999 family)